MRFVVKRLVAGQDLRASLALLMEESGFAAATVSSLVGSLAVAHLRTAGAMQNLLIRQPLEIDSATGTLAPVGMHVHIAVSDEDGRTLGGHLLDGCIVGSTVEVVLAEVTGWRFTREVDAATGYQELVASSLNEQSD